MVTPRGPVSPCVEAGVVRDQTVWATTVFEITNVRFEIADWTKKTVANSSARG